MQPPLFKASNTPWVLDKIKEKTGISAEVIDGRKEAKIISTNMGLQNINIRNKTFLFVDVGEGVLNLASFVMENYWIPNLSNWELSVY